MNAVTRLTDRPRTYPLILVRSIWEPTTATMRRWAVAAIVANIVITVTGAIVRVSKSGLGCPTWPRCTPDSFVPAAHPEISPLNTAIEFGNRMLSFVVLAAALACLITAWRLRPRRTALVRLGWLQLAGVALQGLWGGVVVRSALNPITVSMHFLISIGLIAACFALYVRAGEADGPPVRIVHRDIRRLAYGLTAAVVVLLIAGVVVTGTGPHSGDKAASRFDLDIEMVARLHADVVWIVLGLTFALLIALRVSEAPARARRAALILLGVELAQGVIGYVQYFTAVPAALVAMHVLGATLVWIATLAALHATSTRGPLPARAEPALDAVPA
ncbi:heme A synthase [Spongiactinospora rosea]|uniref:Heme A synthase n=1 Tax=Spongiactinospora rosea TaxID=2248750 RepID=A0A366LZL9_9ACTN|nr:COX15/CtaA family protein [Spongiactinospora rosea]RBQ19010.1 heme A synthase [Spongiactinospora rosea]